MATNIVVAVLALVTGTMAARLLGAQGRGELAAIQIWPSFFSLVAGLGMGEAVVYFSAREPRRAGQYLASASALALLFSLPFVALGFLLIPTLLATQAPLTVAAAQWYLLLIPIQALVGMLLHPLRGRSDLALWNLLRLTPVLGWLALLVSSGLLGVASASSLSAGYLVVLVLLFPVLLAVVIRRIPGPFRPVFGLWPPLLRYGLPSVASSVPLVLNLRLDQMLLAAILVPHELGLYVVSVAWAGAATPLLSAIGAVVFPRVAAEPSAGGQGRALATAARTGSLLAICLALPLLILTPLVVPVLFGEEYRDAVPVALIMIVGGLTMGMNNILEEGLRGLGRPTGVLVSEGTGVIATFLGLVLLLGPLGITGAALASSSGYVVTLAVVLQQIRSVTGYSVWMLLVPKRQDFAALREVAFTLHA